MVTTNFKEKALKYDKRFGEGKIRDCSLGKNKLFWNFPKLLSFSVSDSHYFKEPLTVFFNRKNQKYKFKYKFLRKIFKSDLYEIQKCWH